MFEVQLAQKALVDHLVEHLAYILKAWVPTPPMFFVQWL